MDRNEYLMALIGDRAEELIGKRDRRKTEVKIAAELHPLLETRQSSAETYLSNALAGLLFPSIAQKGTKYRRARFMSAFLYAYRVEEDDVAVNAMRELYPSFQYPPPENHRIRLVDEAKPYIGKYAAFDRADLMNALHAGDWLSQAATDINALEDKLVNGCDEKTIENSMAIINIKLKKTLDTYERLSPAAKYALRQGLILKFAGPMMKQLDLNGKYPIDKSEHNPFPLMEKIDELFS